MATKRIWTIKTTRYDDDEDEVISIDYYDQITKVRKFVNLLCCAGYNEQFPDDQEFTYQVFNKDGKRFRIERHTANLETLSVLI